MRQLKYPWKMRMGDLIPLEYTYPIPSYQPVAAASGSEADMHFASMENRRRECEPPRLRDFPVGTFAIDRWHDLYQLQSVRIDDVKQREIPGGELVEKYLSWFRNGSASLPPIRVVERIDHEKGVSDGHHRLEVAKRAGLMDILAWVSLAHYRPNVNNAKMLHAESLSIWTAYRLAHAMRLMTLPAPFLHIMDVCQRIARPFFYLSDLDIDREILERQPLDRFGWSVRDCGTHLWHPDDEGRRWLNACLEVDGDSSFYYLWNGKKLVEMKGIELLRQL